MNHPRRLIALRLAALAVVALVFGAAPLRAQPMMTNPAQMSGIPRPDPQVPAGTVTVRLIRGSLANNLPGQTVTLVPAGKEAPALAQKTDAQGRATFAGLSPGTYEARADVDGEALASQPIEVDAATGVRVMLVFAQSVAEQQRELGTPDGKARVDQSLPPGELVVQAVGPDGKPLVGAQVVVAHANQRTEQVEELPAQPTGPDGAARLKGLATGSGDGYMVKMSHGQSQLRSQPFRLTEEHGSRLALQVRASTRDVSKISVAAGSHWILELSDETVQVMQVLRLSNPGTEPVDPGPGGLRVPLAEGALSAQVMQGSPPQASLDLGPTIPEVVWRGLLPPGESVMQVAFLLPQHGSVRLHQPVKTRFEEVRALMPLGPGLHPSVDGAGYSGTTHKIKDLFPNFDGPSDRELLMVSGGAPGAAIDFTIEGLPASPRWPRYAAGLVALLLGLIFAVVAARGQSEAADVADRRAALEGRRKGLLEQILKAEAAGKTAEAQRLRGGLEQVYRELDQL